MKRSAASTVPLALVLIAVATTAAAADMTGASNYLVYVEPHPPGVDCQAYQLGILAAALGGYVSTYVMHVPCIDRSVILF